MAASSLQTRCGSSRQFARLLPLPPLPSRTFTSLGIKAFNRFRRLAARLPNPPDFLSLPATGSISRVGYGSPFLDRYVSGGLLFLKPLGTFSTIYLSPFFVNKYRRRIFMISTTFMSPVSRCLQPPTHEFAVEKTRCRTCVVVPIRPRRDRMRECNYPPESANTNWRNSWAEACRMCTALAIP